MVTKSNEHVGARAREFTNTIRELSASPKDWRKFCSKVEKGLKEEARVLQKASHSKQARRLLAMAGSFESLVFCGY